MIIGICGKMGSGKDYVASKYIIPFLEKHNKKYVELAFADQLKVNVMFKYNVPYSDVYIKKNKETRSLLQQEGTENGRDTINKNIWVDYHKLWSSVLTRNNPETFVITTDTRYSNEFDYIKKSGGILIKVVAPKRNLNRIIQEKLDSSQISHRSECDLDNIPDAQFDIVINNDPDSDQSEEHKLLRFLSGFIKQIEPSPLQMIIDERNNLDVVIHEANYNKQTKESWEFKFNSDGECIALARNNFTYLYIRDFLFSRKLNNGNEEQIRLYPDELQVLGDIWEIRDDKNGSLTQFIRG